MQNNLNIFFLTFLLAFAGHKLGAQVHPNLILTKAGVNNIRQSQASAPLFEKVLRATQTEVDAEIAAGIFVPVPKDMAGGYTHERHKKNFFILQKAGNLYQLTGEEKYAVYIREVFKQYAEQYPEWGIHPTDRSYATGKIFWQCLNDANWLVYSSQAYDAIYDFLTEKERKNLEENLFRPLADFISLENPKFFNRIHNHSTWGNAAVGMIGLVMQDEELIERALYGIKNDGLDNTMLDNDGGFIKVEGQNQAGFLAQLDFSFSPDGYFTEGPYYLRYAMTPFLLFSKALANNRPDLKIYEYRDGILEKAVSALLQQTDAQGQFFPINDAQKGMSWNAREVVAAVDIAYHDFGKNPMLLSIAEKQNTVQLDETGYAVARDLAEGLSETFKHKSVRYRDGAEGKKGGIAILRTSKKEEELCAVMKYSAHGMGHGHFDKLSYSLYDSGGEIIQDYGAARWVNIDQKGGGRYLPENNTFAKQSIAHNTLVVNAESHYEGSVKKGEASHPGLYFSDLDNANVQMISAFDSKAYTGAKMHRSLFLLNEEKLENPVLIDVMRVESDIENQYDLPLWFQGQLLQTNFSYGAELNTLKTMGEAHGYQHIWQEAKGAPSTNNASITWFERDRFFTLNTAVKADDELIFGRSGANDPNFNLRRDPCFIIRRPAAKDAVFVSLIEAHGSYNPVEEIPLQPFTSIESVEVLQADRDYTVLRFRTKKGVKGTLALANQNNKAGAQHNLKINNKMISWKGVYHLLWE